MMDAGKLRHRVDIEQRVDVQDTSGDIETTWAPFASSVPAAVEPLSAREFVAAGAVQSKVIARITIRHRPGLDATMRIRHGARIYNPEGFPADKDSGLNYLTIPCSEGVNEG